MTGEIPDSTGSFTSSTIKDKINEASTDVSRSVAAHVSALRAGQAPAQTDIFSVISDVERHIEALSDAILDAAPHSFKQHIQELIVNGYTPDQLRIMIEVLGQTIRQQLGEYVWSFAKPILDPTLEWLSAHTGSADLVQSSSISTSVASYTQSILHGDRIQAEKLVFDLLAQGHSLRDIYLKFIQPSLYEVGRLWEIGQLSIAKEHLATAITQSVLSALYARVDLPTSLEQHALITCLEGNFHEIGPRMLADFLQLAGYNTRFLGTNTSVDCLIEMIQSHRPVVIGLPATTPDHVDTVKLAIERVRVDFASYRPTIMVGGLAFNMVDGLWKTVKADLWSEDGGQAVDQLVGSSDWN